MQINNFSGGLNTRVDPSLLAPSEAVTLSNIDNTSMLLQSVREPVIVDGAPNVFGYFYNFLGTWLSSTAQRSYIEYSNTLYWTENSIKPQKFNGSTTSQIGIVGPTEALVTVEQDSITAPTTLPTVTETTPTADGISPDTEDLTYCYTYYDSVTKRESAKSDDSLVINLAAVKDVTVGNITASTDPSVDTIRLYRIGDGITVMTLVQEVTNTTTDIVDGLATSDINPIIDIGDAGISDGEEVLQYVYTYYNTQKGIESVPSPLSTELTLTANKGVVISNIQLSDNVQVDTIKLYRIGAVATEFTLLAEYPHVTTDLIDVLHTVDADGRLLDSTTNYPPPVDGRFLVEAYGIMFMAVGSNLHFSTVGKPDYFPSTNVIKFSRDITGLFPVPNGLLVFSLSSTELLLGTEAGSFSTLPVSSEQGCLSHYSCKLVKNIPTWVSYDGICNYSSGVIKVVSLDKLGKLSLDIINSAVYDGRYWLNLLDGSILVMDTRFGGLTFKKYTYTVQIDNVLTYNNTLYGRQGDNLVDILKGTVDVPMDYLSPVFTEGDHTNYKSYDNIYIRARSDDANGLEVKTYVDGLLVSTHTLLGDKIFDIKPPAKDQKGSSIQFGIKGVGKVYEINYKVLGRSNGR